MTARLSTRVSIRWLPEPASEDTDTRVLSVGGFFVDVRVRTADKSIDWAMAGQRIVLSKDPLKCKFTHIVDSLGLTAPDEGDFQDLPNGDALETGTMPCPHRNNAMTDYEEVWRPLPFPAGPQRAWVIQSVDDGGKTLAGQVGGLFLAVQERADGGFSARREEWTEEGWKGSWTVKYLIGQGTTPSIAATGLKDLGGGQWKLGEEVELLGRRYRVLAIEDI